MPSPHTRRGLTAAVLTLALAAVAVAAATSRVDDQPDGGRDRTTSGNLATLSPTQQRTCATFAAAALTPEPGHNWLSASLDWPHDEPAAYATRLGASPAVYNQFVALPMPDGLEETLDRQVHQIADAHAMLTLTVEPWGGLDAVTPAVIEQLADMTGRWQRWGVPVLVNYAGEMNGDWGPWSADPDAYIASYRAVAKAVHASGSYAKMVWTPNYGGGYPFTDTPDGYHAQPGTTAFAALDTSHNGRLDQRDDPYAPYWPGDDAVDWVGMSLYHWSNTYPYTRNDITEPNVVARNLLGTYRGAIGDERYVPNFYDTYATRHHKPMALTETGALFVPAWSGAREVAVKRPWWRQVYSSAMTERFPRLALVNWFEPTKRESDLDQVARWGLTETPAVANAFLSDLPATVSQADRVPTCHS